MAKGFLAFHLHAHLPFIKHPEHPSFLEERWYFDAIVDTYVPLFLRFEELYQSGVPFRLSMTMSPSLLSMFGDGFLSGRFRSHLASQRELCDRELERTKSDPQFGPVVQMYNHRLELVEQTFERFAGNLANAYRDLESWGCLELTTCGASHGFLPHMQLLPGAVGRQLRYAVECHRKVLGKRPDGIWLPECAYYPGLEEQLLEHGLLYFFVDTHGVQLGNPRSLRGPYSHVYMPNGVAAFARDPYSSKQVWSSKEGYPGDGLYRDFYRDIGFDLPLDYVAPYIHQGKTRILTGLKYYAITGDTEHKKVYSPGAAQAKVAEHAQHFIHEREKQVEWLASRLDRKPLIVSPYDAELFGHWWFEGPDFLYHVIKEAASSAIVELAAARDYLLLYQSAQVVIPNASTWGNAGYNGFWTNRTNEWIYPHLAAGARLADQITPEIAYRGRARRQAERELLLAQASDWAFIMSTDTSPDYAAQRTITHLANLAGIGGTNGAVDSALLDDLERRNSAF